MTTQSQSEPTLTMLVVGDAAHEEQALLAVSALEAQHGTPVVTVLDEHGLAKRLGRLWTRLGIAHRRVRYRSVDASRSGRKRPNKLLGLPGAVFVSPRVDPAVRRLVESLLRRSTVRLQDAADQPHPSRTKEPTALALVSLEDVTPATFSALHAIVERGFVLGTLFVEQGWLGRFVVLKSLTTGHVRRRGGFRIVGKCDDGWSRGARQPANISMAAIAPPTKHSDVLIVFGHANSWDLVATDRLILCARAGVKHPDRASGALPCFYGAECTRQLELGRRAQSRTGLTAVSRLRGTVLVLWGCNVIRLGHGMRHGLLYQACLSDVVAVITTTGLPSSDPSEQTLLLGLLAEGSSLGTVVAEFNRSVDNRHGVGQQGRFMLFGNPSLRLIGEPPVSVRVRAIPDGVSLDIPRRLSERPEGCFVRTSAREATNGNVLVRTSPDAWFYGGYLSDGRGYFWATSRRVASRSDPLRVDLLPLRDSSDLSRTTAVQLFSALQHWPRLLDRLRRASTNEPSTALFEQWLARIPFTLLMLEFRTLESRIGSWPFTVRGSIALRDDEPVPADVVTLSDGLMACLLKGAKLFGMARLLDFTPGTGPEIMTPVANSLCACGRGSLCLRHRLQPGGARSAYAERQCEACGAIAIDDGRRVLQLARCDTSVQQGSRLGYSLQCVAPDREHLHVVHAGVLAPWSTSHAMVTTPHHAAAVPPGSQAILNEAIVVPDRFARGMHRAGIYAVVSGAFWFFGWNVEVT